MGFNVAEAETWIRQYESIWKKVQGISRQKLEEAPLNNGKYVNPKLISWDGEIRTGV